MPEERGCGRGAHERDQVRGDVIDRCDEVAIYYVRDGDEQAACECDGEEGGNHVPSLPVGTKAWFCGVAESDDVAAGR